MESELMNSQNGVLGELMKNECTRFGGVIYSLNFFIKGTILAEWSLSLVKMDSKTSTWSKSTFIFYCYRVILNYTLARYSVEYVHQTWYEIYNRLEIAQVNHKGTPQCTGIKNQVFVL